MPRNRASKGMSACILGLSRPWTVCELFLQRIKNTKCTSSVFEWPLCSPVVQMLSLQSTICQHFSGFHPPRAWPKNIFFYKRVVLDLSGFSKQRLLKTLGDAHLRELQKFLQCSVRCRAHPTFTLVKSCSKTLENSMLSYSRLSSEKSGNFLFQKIFASTVGKKSDYTYI